MHEPKKPGGKKKNPRNRKASGRERESWPDEKSQTFRGGKRERVRGRTGDTPAN